MTGWVAISCKHRRNHTGHSSASEISPLTSVHVCDHAEVTVDRTNYYYCPTQPHSAEDAEKNFSTEKIMKSQPTSDSAIMQQFKRLLFYKVCGAINFLVFSMASGFRGHLKSSHIANKRKNFHMPLYPLWSSWNILVFFWLKCSCIFRQDVLQPGIRLNSMSTRSETLLRAHAHEYAKHMHMNST